MDGITTQTQALLSVLPDGLAPLVVPGATLSVLERWDAVVRAVPDQTALTSPGRGYTFRQVDLLSDQVAEQLVLETSGDESPVGLFVDQTADGIVGLLAIMKAGRIVVVLDPHLPLDRLRTIAELAGSTTCLADADNAGTARELGQPVARVLDLSLLLAPSGQGSPDAAVALAGPRPLRGGPDAACIVFTSGSTGRPKGVIQTHDQLLNEAFANGERFRITAQDRVALVLPYGFAAGLSLLFVALLNGAGLWSFDPRDLGTRRLVSWIDDHELTTLHCTPHLLRSLVGVLDEQATLPSLRVVCTVGEAVHARDVAGIRPHLDSSCTFYNWTGSSEMGTLSCYEIPGSSPLPEGNIPAGLPVANKDVEIRTEDGALAAHGEAGELIAISDYLSGGYWRDDASNATRFGVHADGRRLCRQGDLARIDDDGQLVLLGRSDAAIKVRGYLVEPSEIEAALMAEEEVREVVVVPVVAPPAPTRLVAYVVPHPGFRTQSPAALRRRLRERLPDYMVPATIVNIAELPRNDRGKVERARLPVPQRTLTAPPTTQWELVIADLWSEVLGLEFVGLDEDFLALGGDSLSVEEMLVSVQERFGVALVSSDLVEAPTLKEFTRRVTLGSASLPSHPDVVTLQSGSALPPLFCFAGSGALALSFLPLSRHLSDRSVYAFQAHGLERRGVPDWSLAASAQRFLELMRVIQPRGPYRLIGHSFGGLVALEIAKLLQEGGEEVELVVLLDTYLPRSAGLQPTFTYETLPDRPAGPSTPGKRLAEVALRQVRKVLPDGLPVVAEWTRHGRSYLAGIVPFSGQRQFDAFFDHGSLVSRRYQVTPYPGRAVVVFADENPDGPAAWNPLLTGSSEFVDLASEHSSLLREPHASQLAAIINAELSVAAR